MLFNVVTEVLGIITPEGPVVTVSLCLDNYFRVDLSLLDLNKYIGECVAVTGSECVKG